MSAHSRSDSARATTLDDFFSGDGEMRACLERARLGSKTDLPVLLLGESGTGKTILARAIHNSSARASGPFVAFNGAALSDTLLDSQLFGHERGAFTGALRTVKGKFELAHEGTLFIDEIADLSLAAQSKILRAVEYGEFERLGGEQLHVADVRLISATHLPLQRHVESGRFRSDLFHRIRGITVTIPPLRDRPRDLRTLIGTEIADASRRQGKAIVGMTRAVADRLFAYHWPGNLRELQRVLDVAVALTEGDVIAEDALVLGEQDRASASSTPPNASDGPDDGDLSLAAAERRHIAHVLDIARGRKRQAARLLHLSRSTLDRKLAAMQRPRAAQKD